MRLCPDISWFLTISLVFTALPSSLGCSQAAQAIEQDGSESRPYQVPESRPSELTDADDDQPAAAAEAAGPRPRVRLVATGGTISNRRGGRLTAEQLVDDLPDLRRYMEVEHEQFANAGSATLTLAQWLELSRRLNTLFREQPDLAGLVVTSGTDTLEELAWFLHLTVRDPRPVVVTGAMRNPSQVAPDGPANLLAAFRVAASPDARDRGALVVLNDEIHSARDVTKSDALRLHTFVSRPGGTLGVVDQDRVVFTRHIDARHTAASEFDVFAFDELPRVDVLMVYQGAPGDLIKAAVDLGARGVVVAAAGTGAISGTQPEGLRYAIEQGRIVVTATRTGAGRVAPRRAPAPTPAPAATPVSGLRVAGEDHTPLKARVLLMLALAAGVPTGELARVFDEY